LQNWQKVAGEFDVIVAEVVVPAIHAPTVEEVKTAVGREKHELPIHSEERESILEGTAPVELPIGDEIAQAVGPPIRTRSAGSEARDDWVLAVHVQHHLRHIGARVVRVGDYLRCAGSHVQGIPGCVIRWEEFQEKLAGCIQVGFAIAQIIEIRC
jgi:hypothetical protein